VIVGVAVGVRVGVAAGVPVGVAVGVGVTVGVGVLDSALYVELLETSKHPGVGVYRQSQIKHGPSTPITIAE
jgi:hypothetical protein